ncbi:hypothetical protein ACWXWU_06980 [Shewanella sp. A14]
MNTQMELITHEEYLFKSRRKFIKQTATIAAISTLPLTLTYSKDAKAWIDIIVTVVASIVSGVVTYYITTREGGDVTIDENGRRVRVWINQDYCVNCAVCEGIAGSGARLEVIKEVCPVDAVEWKYE